MTFAAMTRNFDHSVIKLDPNMAGQSYGCNMIGRFLCGADRVAIVINHALVVLVRFTIVGGNRVH